jgi:hypothetical protein
LHRARRLSTLAGKRGNTQLTITRRHALGVGLAAAAALRPRTPCAAGEAPGEAPADFGLAPLGKLRPVSPLVLRASPLSVGFETLDRRHFDPEKTFPHLATLGAKWARCQTGWCRCEAVAGQFEFGWLDAVVDGLLKLGIQPWFNLGYGNRLYIPEATDEAAVGWAPVFSETARQAWLRFVRAIAEHFAKRVRHWEIWNEPNITSFWKPKQPNPGDYVALVGPTAAEIRRIVPGAVIIGGAFAGIPISYLKGCLEAGLAEMVDKISYHPYRPVPEAKYETEIRALRELIAAQKQGIEIWQGENGCPSQGGKQSAGALANLQWDELRQAKWLLRRILSDLRLGVELTSYYHTVDLVGYRGLTNFKGLLRGADYSPKPAFYAYQCLCALFDAETKRQTDLRLELLEEEIDSFQAAGFVRDGSALYAFWYPADLQKGWQPRKVRIRVSVMSGGTIDAAVLIDPLSGRISAVKSPAVEKGTLSFDGLPLLDYPLLLTDRKVALPR